MINTNVYGQLQALLDKLTRENPAQANLYRTVQGNHGLAQQMAPKTLGGKVKSPTDGSNSVASLSKTLSDVDQMDASGMGTAANSLLNVPLDPTRTI